jgi:hypothetical protein
LKQCQNLKNRNTQCWAINILSLKEQPTLKIRLIVYRENLC